jgi:dTDP-D-glucose 4,6-dehydratase
LIRFLIKESSYKILVLDNLTYAENLESLKEIEKLSQFEFLK